MWKQTEIDEYSQVDSPYLSALYADAGIPVTKPEERAEFLAEEVIYLTMTDHDVLMRTAHDEGRADVLNLLEQMAIDN